MILLDQPFVSEFLLQTIAEHRLPVVITDAAREFGVGRMPSAISEAEAVVRAAEQSDPLVYTVSESSIAWVAEHLATTELPRQIERFKDKARFRRDTAALFPGLVHREIAIEDLGRFDPSGFPLPFIIKPAVGFFSLGVRRVDTVAQWPAVRAEIEAELSRVGELFPRQVVDASRLLVEPYIDGREFAVDAYFDACGEPVILSLLEHRFASEMDTSDRVYITSAELIEANLERFTRFLGKLGQVFAVRNFPLHLELRVDAEGRLWPIEVNPARFGGWCTTADLTYQAYGVNPYACLFRQARPDWDQVLRGKHGQVFAVVALGNTTGVEGRLIRSFDYEALCSRFEHLLELRRTDFRRYPIFGFLFTQTQADNPAELDWVLQSDLSEFATTG